jgi:hypothetical protein
MQGKLAVLTVSFLFASACLMSPSAGADPQVAAAAEVPKEVRALEGTYTGSWTMYGIDEKGEVVKRMAWTDTMTASGSEVAGDRALVSTMDEMTFEGGQIPPFKVPGKEGYFLNKDGGLGDYFIEAAGQTSRLQKIGANVWTCTTPAMAQELGRLGFPKDASAQHVLVKVVTDEQGVETHRISRLGQAMLERNLHSQHVTARRVELQLVVIAEPVESRPPG